MLFYVSYKDKSLEKTLNIRIKIYDIGDRWMDKLKVKVEYKDQKYPYIQDKQINLTEIGDREKGRMIFISGRFVKTENNEKFIEFERINEFVVKLNNAKFTVTEKGTYVIKYEEGSTLYLVEIPSGYRGSANAKVISGECYESIILRSPAGSLGEVKHLWCNGNAEISFSISGRTRTAGYGALTRLFGENLSGKIVIKDGQVNVIEDEQLDKLLS